MPSRRRLAAITLAAAAVAVPIAGCGGSDGNDSSTSAATSAAPAQTTGGTGGGAGGNSVDLSATEFKFTPSDTTVSAGEVTFSLKNGGQVQHSLEIEDVNGQDKELEGDVSPGQSGTLKVNLPPGTYQFYCPVDGHRAMGMTGKITVK